MTPRPERPDPNMPAHLLGIALAVYANQMDVYADQLERELATEREKAKAFEKAAHTKEEP